MDKVKSAYKKPNGEWVFPQVHFLEHGGEGTIAREALLEKLQNDALLQEALRLDSEIKHLFEEAKQERCVMGYDSYKRFYNHYKPVIVEHVGREGDKVHVLLATVKHYDAVYDAILQLLPADEQELYREGTMPNGMYRPSLQERYGRAYPTEEEQ